MASEEPESVKKNIFIGKTLRLFISSEVKMCFGYNNIIYKTNKIS
jgi:hypothetical protein